MAAAEAAGAEEANRNESASQGAQLALEGQVATLRDEAWQGAEAHE